MTYKWDKVFKNGPSEICGRQPLENLKGYGLLKFFKGCLPQILLGPFLNTLSQMQITIRHCWKTRQISLKTTPLEA